MSDISIFAAAEGLFVSGPIGAILHSAGITAVEIVRFPQALTAAYKRLWKENKIGPRLKVLISLSLPAAGILFIFIAPIAAFVYGYFKGFVEGTREIFKASYDFTVTAFDEAGNLFVSADEYKPDPLPEGERPFDIRVLEMLRGLLCGALSSVVQAPSFFFTMLIKWPKLAFWLLKNIPSKDEPVLSGSLLILGLGLSPLLIPLSGLTGALVGLVVGTKEGYTEGFLETAKWTVDNIKAWWETVEDIVSG